MMSTEPLLDITEDVEFIESGRVSIGLPEQKSTEATDPSANKVPATGHLRCAGVFPFQWMKPHIAMHPGKSSVWKHFDSYIGTASNGDPFLKDGKNVTVVRCKLELCRHKELLYNGSSTRAMRNHLTSVHQMSFVDGESGTNEGVTQGPDLKRSASGIATFCTKKKRSIGAEDPDLDQDVLKFVVTSRMPFSSVENPSFVKILDRVNPLYKDSPTRWDSMLSMLRSALRNFDCVNRVATEQSKGAKGIEFEALSDGDKRVLTGLVGVLALFEEATMLASSTREPVSAYIPVSLALKTALKRKSKDLDLSVITAQIIGSAMASLEKRFFNGDSDVLRHEYLLKSMYMDPRFSCRLDLLPHDKWQFIRMITENSAINFGACISNANTHDSAPPATLRDESPSNEETLSFVLPDKRKCTVFQDETEVVVRQKISTEMTIYEGLLQKYGALKSTDDLKKFWQENSETIPYLTAYARMILSPPLGSVDIERLFSVTSSLLSNKARSRLSDDSICSLLMLREFYSKESLYFAPEVPGPYSDDYLQLENPIQAPDDENESIKVRNLSEI